MVQAFFTTMNAIPLHILVITATLCTIIGKIMKHTLFTIPLVATALFGSLFVASPALAVVEPGTGGGTTSTSTTNCSILPAAICNAAKNEKDVKKSGVFLLLIWVLNILTAAVGIAAVGALVYAGILYASAGSSNEQVSKSKNIITNTVIGIVAYGLMYLALNWLVPGGVIG